MQRSEGRILTTHAGSLPRPPELVAMFADRVPGRPVAPEALAAAIEDATAWVLPKQLDAGIDIPNNGEQPRDAFFLYVRHRMSGFAGLDSRQGPADVARYPGFLAMRQQSAANKVAVTNFDVPKVVGQVRYLDPVFVETECADFRRILTARAPEQRETFITAPRPASSPPPCRTNITIARKPISTPWPPPCKWNTRPSSRTASPCNWTAPI